MTKEYTPEEFKHAFRKTFPIRAALMSLLSWLLGWIVILFAVAIIFMGITFIVMVFQWCLRFWGIL